MKDENNTEGEVTVNDGATAMTVISWIFGIVFFAIGVVNIFWGNDPGFGISIMLLSFLYFVPVHTFLHKMIGFSIPRMQLVKILLGIYGRGRIVR